MRTVFEPVPSSIQRLLASQESATETIVSQFTLHTEKLSELIDLRGAVFLQENLQTNAHVESPFEQEQKKAFAKRLSFETKARIDAVDARLKVTLFSNVRSPFHEPEDLLQLFEELGFFSLKIEKLSVMKTRIDRFVDASFSAPKTWVHNGLERARSELSHLRSELGEDLKSFGSKAATLNELDKVFRKAIETKMSERISRLSQGYLPLYRETVRKHLEYFLALKEEMLSSEMRPEDEFLLEKLRKNALDSCSKIESEVREAILTLLCDFVSVERKTIDALVSEEVLCS